MTGGPWRRAAALVALGGAVALSAEAQDPVRQPPPPPPRDTVPAPPQQGRPRDPETVRRTLDSLNRGRGPDSLRRGLADSARGKPTLIQWAPDDSVMTALLKREGYSVVRYQADTVGFAAETRTMSLGATPGTKAGVQRDSTLLVATKVQYNDSLQVLTARGDTIVMRDPARGEDVTGLQEMTYDLARREGKTYEFSTVANSGEDWAVRAHRAAFSSDTARDRTTVYGRDGVLTSCLDSVPHYHFRAGELKRVSGSLIVARPAILYVQDVPVMWLPFIFQDIRTGRRSGLLTPRMGFSEVVRNSPTYRRTIENLGYYFALTDYVDAQVSVDWRSRARETEQDPGWTRLNGELRYRWLDRFMSGQIALQQSNISNGSRNTGVSWSHTQEFSSRTRFSTNLNYVTNTQVQRRTQINPLAAAATIASQANLVRLQGPLSINVGGSQTQYPGRDQIDRRFPSLSVASKPLTLGEWFVITPTFNASNSESLNLDAAGDFVWRYTSSPAGLDSTRLQRNRRASTMSLSTPFKIFDFQVQSGLTFNDNFDDFPSLRTVPDPNNPGGTVDRVYAQTFLSTFDYTISIGLPQFLKGTWNFAPSVSLSNPAGQGAFVRSERTSGAWVSQAKRVSYGAGVSPTVFRLLPGFGPVERMRHAISPTLSWSYSPAIDVSDEYLLALGQDPARFIGGIAQNRLSLGIATNLEAKMRGAPGDTAANGDANARKVRVASIQFTPLSYDFELAKKTGGTGLATDRLGYTFRSDLLPGFDLGVDYSLFQGSVLTDTAVFKPFRETVRFGFELNNRSAIVRKIASLFGAAPPPAAPRGAGSGPGGPRDAMGGGLVSSRDPSQQGLGAITGTRGRGAVQELNPASGFTASFSVSQQRQRPPVGGRVAEWDPASVCQDLVGLPNYDFCVEQAERNPPNDLTPPPSTAGGTFFRIPPTTSVGVRTTFNLTPKWSAGWSTTYDVERSSFASQVVTLQRELHDWRAVFGFTQAPNGNVAFTFFISLKAQPDIKLDYDRQTYRQPTSTP